MGLTLSGPKETDSRKKHFGPKKKPQKWYFRNGIRRPGRAGPGRAGPGRAGSEFDFLDIILATAALRAAGKPPQTSRHPAEQMPVTQEIEGVEFALLGIKIQIAPFLSSRLDYFSTFCSIN